jgi:hypothetical protein
MVCRRLQKVLLTALEKVLTKALEKVWTKAWYYWLHSIELHSNHTVADNQLVQVEQEHQQN